MPDAVHKVTVEITEQLLRQTYSKHCQTFKIEHLKKKKCVSAGAKPETFQGKVGGRL